MLFKYRVIDKEGNESEGNIDAHSEDLAINTLFKRGFTVLSITPISQSETVRFSFLRRVKTKDKVIFFRQIATLFEASVPPVQALNLVSESMQNEHFREVIRDIAGNVDQGVTLEKSFARHRELFGDFYISIIKVGEASATLHKSFKYLAEYTERNAKIVNSLRKALTYPIFIVITFFAVVILMLVTVIPQVSSILIQSGTELPLITKVVIGLSDFFKENVVFILFGVFAAIAALIYWGRTEGGKDSIDSIVLTLPVVGKLFQTFYIVRLTTNLGVMLGADLPQARALQITSSVIGNRAYTRLVEGAEDYVKKGIPLSTALGNQDLVSRHVTQFIKVGEATGKTAEMLRVISELYEDVLQNVITRTLDLIQPTVIILLGITVGGLIGSVIVPIYSITSGI